MTAENRIDQAVKPKPATTRRYENDWLTILATLAVFLFHCARYFNDEGWHVKNPVESTTLSVGVVVASRWIMPLFFLLSGMSSGYSLTSRGALRYLKDRAKRLMVPFLFSVFVVSIPLQVWVERVTHGDFSGTFLEFYPRYFDGFYAFGGNFAWMGLHLWYLLFLFLFSILTLPLFQLFQARRIKSVILNMARRRNGYVPALIFAIPLFILEYLVGLDPKGLGIRAFGGWSPVYYLCIFCIGYIMTFSHGYGESCKKSAPIALAFAIITTTLIVLVTLRVHLFDVNYPYAVKALVLSLNSWSWIVAIYGMGRRYLNFTNAKLTRLREIALPFYILHQTIIVFIGYLILQWDIPVLPKFIFLAASSFCAIVMLIEIIKRFNLIRPLFGMKRLPRAA